MKKDRFFRVYFPGTEPFHHVKVVRGKVLSEKCNILLLCNYRLTFRSKNHKHANSPPLRNKFRADDRKAESLITVFIRYDENQWNELEINNKRNTCTSFIIDK